MGKINVTEIDGSKCKAKELCAAIVTGFHCALRIGALESLGDRDISFEEVDNVMCVAIVIRGSKTDQQKLGARRTLAATGCDLCPAQCLVRWLDLKGWCTGSGESLFSNSIASMINRALKEIAAEHGIDATLISTHSLTS